MKSLSILCTIGLVVAACASEATAPVVSDAGPSVDGSTADAGSTNDAAGDAPLDGSTTSDAPTTGPLPISLETALDPSKSYRLAIVWFQLDDDGPDPVPELVRDVPFSPNTTGIDLGDLSKLKVPGEPNLLCTRDGDDEALFPCRSDSPYKFGLSLIVVVEDINKNGVSEFFPKGSADSIALYAWGSLVHSVKGGDILPIKNGEPVLIDGTPKQGTFLYESYDPAGTFDRLKPFTNGGTLAFKKKSPNWT